MSEKKSQSQSSVIPMAETDIVHVSKEFFIDGMLLPVRIYMELSAGNYLLVGKKGEKTNFTSLHSFKNESTSVYVRTEDYNDLMRHMAEFTGKLVVTKNVPDATKLKFLSGLTEQALAAIKESDFASVVQIEKVSNFVISLSQSLKDFGQVIELLENLPNNQSKHAMATCFISITIAEEMKLNHQIALEKLSLGALLHNIGLRFIPESILKKPKHLWTPEENSIYETHPTKGAEMLRDLKDISNDILFIVAEHHENSMGTGFPRRLRDVKISPLGRIVALASCFTELLYSRLPDTKEFTADQAIEYIDEILGQPFNKQAFSALKTIINKKYLMDKVNKTGKAS